MGVDKGLVHLFIDALQLREGLVQFCGRDALPQASAVLLLKSDGSFLRVRQVALNGRIVEADI
jgi:hypothetical protein